MAISSLFDLKINNTASVGKELWINLGLIPTNQRNWIGFAGYSSPDKTIACEIRTNNTGQSTGTITNTSILSSSSVRVGNTVNNDLYRKGRLHIVTAYGTGIESWWLHLTSKTTTLGSLIYTINYTQE